MYNYVTFFLALNVFVFLVLSGVFLGEICIFKKKKNLLVMFKLLKYLM